MLCSVLTEKMTHDGIHKHTVSMSCFYSWSSGRLRDSEMIVCILRSWIFSSLLCKKGDGKRDMRISDSKRDESCVRCHINYRDYIPDEKWDSRSIRTEGGLSILSLFVAGTGFLHFSQICWSENLRKVRTRSVSHCDWQRKYFLKIDGSAFVRCWVTGWRLKIEGRTSRVSRRSQVPPVFRIPECNSLRWLHPWISNECQGKWDHQKYTQGKRHFNVIRLHKKSVKRPPASTHR